MTDKYVYVENPMKLVINLMLLILFFFTAVSVITGNSLDTIIVITASLFGFSALFVLIASFLKQRTVICDSRGCEIWTKRFWSGKQETDRFEWKDVTSTRVDEIDIGESTSLRFEIKARGKTRGFTMKHIFSRSFDKLITVVNQATPHLPYIWVKSPRTSIIQVFELVPRYDKIPRV